MIAKYKPPKAFTALASVLNLSYADMPPFPYTLKCVNKYVGVGHVYKVYKMHIFYKNTLKKKKKKYVKAFESINSSGNM